MQSFTSAKIIADSISGFGVRITTFELEFPRIVLAEFNTHRLFSRNAASTRAIPLKSQLEYLVNRYFEPSPFTKNRPGMTSNDPIEDQNGASKIWRESLEFVAEAVKNLSDLGVAKQHAGRLLEPFTHIKVVVTATEYDNFFWLRKHPDAQPEIQRLAEVMWDAREASKPIELHPGDWHVPYYRDGYWGDSGYLRLSEPDMPALDSKYPNACTLQEALAISASCCAQVSYRRLDDSLDKAQDIYKRLVESKPVHASPFEHQATPIDPKIHGWSDGITSDGPKGIWSGNFRGWIQHRQQIDNNVCWEYES